MILKMLGFFLCMLKNAIGILGNKSNRIFQASLDLHTNTPKMAGGANMSHMYYLQANSATLCLRPF